MLYLGIIPGCCIGPISTFHSWFHSSEDVKSRFHLSTHSTLPELLHLSLDLDSYLSRPLLKPTFCPVAPFISLIYTLTPASSSPAASSPAKNVPAPRCCSLLPRSTTQHLRLPAPPSYCSLADHASFFADTPAPTLTTAGQYADRKPFTPVIFRQTP
ncbi:hypothetical protein KSP39_PZI010431 [Platanthera zijinensis]|uniref:Uncharacterized protein n=1 Tax=Platanthera zijinensis TaxID=2320716 RepID=A0AAP0BIQ3_9ASPA